MLIITTLLTLTASIEDKLVVEFGKPVTAFASHNAIAVRISYLANTQSLAYFNAHLRQSCEQHMQALIN